MMTYFGRLLPKAEQWLISSYGKGLFAVLLVWGSYFILLWPRLLYWKNGMVFAGWIGIYSDWMAHFAYSGPFAYRPLLESFSGHPLYFGHPFMYPFAADALSGLLIRAGFNIVSAFIIPSIITSILLLIALFRFYYYLSEYSGKVAFVAVSLFLTSGGLGFIAFINNFPSSLGPDLYPQLAYTHLSVFGIEWSNVVTAQLIPQRALLLGMTIILLILVWIYRHWLNDFKQVKLARIFLVGALSGVMVVVHVHAYMAFIVFCGSMLVLKPRLWLNWLIFASGAALVALPLYQIFYSGGIDSTFISWHVGWVSQSDQLDMNIIRFWLINWGFFLPVAAWGIFRFHYLKNPFIIGSIIIFVSANLFLFQVFPQANDKLFIWVYLILCIPVSRLLVDLWTTQTRRYIYKAIAISLFIVLTASGTLDLWRILYAEKHSHQLWSTSDIELANQFKKISAPTDLVLTSNRPNHWAPTLTGRPILLGYQGWLWSYGINYGNRQTEVQTMFNGGESGDKLLSQYNVAYVIYDSSLTENYTSNEAYYKANYPQVLSDDEYRVYKIK